MSKFWLVLFIIMSIQQTSCNSIFCSVICSKSSCNNNDPSPNACTACNTNWVQNGTTCSPNLANNYFYFDKTNDLGGNLVVQSFASTSSQCSYNIYGLVNAVNSITVKSSAGISQTFSQMIVYFGIFTVDVGVSSNSVWNYNNAYFNLQFTSGDGQTFTNSYQLMGSTFVIKNNLCSLSTVTQHWNKISQSYSFTTPNVSLTFVISTNQTTSTNKWGMKEFVIIYKGCDSLCLTCFGASNSQCYSCVYSAATNSSWLSGTTCSATCLSQYGYTSNASYCVHCDSHCTSCFQTATNCTACTVSGSNMAYFYAANFSCINPCPALTFANETTQTCDSCSSSCATCTNSPSYCTSCATGYWYEYTCYTTCPVGTFNASNSTNCTNCDYYCLSCTGSSALCTVCKTAAPYTAYLYNTTNSTGSCLRTCPQGTYEDSTGGVNLCLPCNSSCAYCTGNPSPCQQCSAGYYLYNNSCINSCPAGLFQSNATGTGQCLDINVVGVDLTLSMYFSNALNSQIYIDLFFSQNLNFTTFNYQTFQSITINSGNLHYTLDMFDISYKILSNSSYRVILKPASYIFLYNATFTVTTQAQPNTTDYSTLLMPFKPSNYLQSASLTWFLIQGPPFSTFQTNVMTSFATLSQKTNNFLSLPYVQEIKKSGLFSLLFSGAQITSCSVLSNQIQSQNLYQGVRFWAIFVFFDVPPYEQISNQTKNFVVPSVESMIRNAQQVDLAHSPSARRLFSTDVLYWRFQRTGQTSFFIYDCYVPAFLLALCWLSLLLAHKLQKTRWYGKHASKVYSAVHKVHEVSIMYVTMAAIVEFTYFQATSAERLASAIVCLLFNVYFVGYELFIYYEMMKYPLAEIGNAHYDYFVTHYGCFLKNVRYSEYEIHQRWSPSHWFRPYNFHLLSYYKKFAMMVALPLFYSTKYAQMGTLLAIQLLQIVRVCCVWPFVSRVRNYLRLSLQIALALFFLVNVVQITLIETIQSGDISEMGQTISIFYGLGWAGFLLCFYFNLAHIAIGIYDFLVGLRVSTRAKMDNARKKYYYQKIKSYEKENEAASKQVVNKWIKLGNLNDQIHGQLSEINVRIELYQMKKSLGQFEVSVRKIKELKMMKRRNYAKKNNTVTTKKYQKQAVLVQQASPILYQLLHSVYSTYANNHVETVILKTFLNVFQPDFEEGESIPFERSKMFQKVQLISYENEREERELDSLIQGFPAQIELFQNF